MKIFYLQIAFFCLDRLDTSGVFLYSFIFSNIWLLLWCLFSRRKKRRIKMIAFISKQTHKFKWFHFYVSCWSLSLSLNVLSAMSKRISQVEITSSFHLVNSMLYYLTFIPLVYVNFSINKFSCRFWNFRIEFDTVEPISVLFDIRNAFEIIND